MDPPLENAMCNKCPRPVRYASGELQRSRCHSQFDPSFRVLLMLKQHWDSR